MGKGGKHTNERNEVRYVQCDAMLQSDGNSFCGDFVLDSFNMAYRDEYSILNKKRKGRYLEVLL